MKTNYVLLVLVCVVWLFSGLVQGAIPATERAALIALYNSTDGDNWSMNSGWKTPPLHTDGFALPGTEKDWVGIDVETDHVIEVSLIGLGLKGTLPAALGNLSYLKGLWLGGNLLSGSIPAELGKLANLTHLELYDNQLSGPMPRQLGNLGSLTHMNLFQNQLSGSIPPEFGNLRNLRFLILFENQLSGNIPATLGNLSKLELLLLAVNHLSGSIPEELGNLDNLKQLGLGSNQLSGSIPITLGNLSNIRRLLLDTNQLSGHIPSQFGALSNLERLYLHDNKLDGRIPNEIGILCNLTDLYLFRNKLRGAIPRSFTNLGALVELKMSYNCLYATDPGLREWLNHHDPEWEVHQDQCGILLPEKDPPFGFFETPMNGTSVSGSIAVTGWALDDGGLESVKIYLNKAGTAIFIGEAIFIEGARPDVASAYPQYPDNTKAGWGYMMLTHFLPDGGNGTYVFSAIATDFTGKTTRLGTKTILVDNAHAVKPFGAIDTPTQGGIASGSYFTNWGWVLTPQPNKIPTQGSTIRVWVDGVHKGHPIYNNYRVDIATLFPGYANSNGAVGYFYLDTTKYSNGLHTIQWTATDNAGNTDGIGSRYFTIQNTPADKDQQYSIPATKIHPQTIATLPMDTVEPLSFHNGFNFQDEYQELLPEQNGNFQIVIKEMEPISIQLGEKYTAIQGYMSGGTTLTKLPIGSTLDKKSRTFSWSPGPGFIGSYAFVFVLTDKNGAAVKKSIKITIEPK